MNVCVLQLFLGSKLEKLTIDFVVVQVQNIIYLKNPITFSPSTERLDFIFFFLVQKKNISFVLIHIGKIFIIIYTHMYVTVSAY